MAAHCLSTKNIYSIRYIYIYYVHYIVGSLCRQKLGASLSSVAVVVDGKRRKAAKTKTARDKVAKISNYASQGQPSSRMN